MESRRSAQLTLLPCLALISIRLVAENYLQEKLGSVLNTLTVDQIKKVVNSDKLSEILHLPIFDNQDPSYHFYINSTEICSASRPDCTQEKVFELLRHYPSPFYCGDPVENADVTYIFCLGHVVHVVNQDNLMVANLTMAGLHLLDPGKVVRLVSMRANQEGQEAMFIDTIGDGLGPMAFLNELFSGVLWTFVDYWAINDSWN